MPCFYPFAIFILIFNCTLLQVSVFECFKGRLCVHEQLSLAYFVQYSRDVVINQI